MSLPVYHHIHLKTDSTEEIMTRMNMEMNIKNPVAIHVENFDHDQQREIIGVIENFFDSTNLSYKFPYPVYFISTLESSVTQMPLVKAQDELPKFFFQKEGRMNVKETHLALKNRLLHQEIRNVDPKMLKQDLEAYADTHKIIFEMEKESSFYKDLLNKLSGRKSVDKKKGFGKQPDDLRGFEEFIEGENDRTFMGKGHPSKKEVSFEHFTFLTNDSERLIKLKNLLTDKLPFMTRFPQGKSLLNDQEAELKEIKDQLFEINDKKNSSYRKSLQEVFDIFFTPPKL